MEITGWGRNLKESATIFSPNKSTECSNILKKGPLIARGLGRSYGDSANNTKVFSTVNLNKVLNFDSSSGSIECESGMSLKKLLPIIIPKGWFLPG